jgi:outer membrane protein OmpA-like peptidoglycan-associated protein
MKKIISLILVVYAVTAHAQDVQKCEGTEPAYLNRIPGFDISNCENINYFEYAFEYNAGGKYIVLKKAGKYQEIWYKKNSSQTRNFSSTQIVKNYADAIRKVKGKVLADDNSVMTASIDGKEVYIHVYNGRNTDENQFYVRIIETGQMQQDIVVSLQQAIDTEGKAALYGILFDVGKAVVKPASADALQQIVDYLNSNQQANIIVVGHTDNSGNYDANVALSKARANSVRTWLVSKANINGARIKAEGAGQFCPVATNTTEEGKAKNRRVEIVKQ